RVELRADGPLEAVAQSEVFELEVLFDGELFAWADGEGMDSLLRPEDMDPGLPVRGDSGGELVRCLMLEVVPGQRLAFFIGAEAATSSAVLELHLVACPETHATRRAYASAEAALASARELDP